MKGKLPALTANLNFSGKYLVLTTGNRKIGFSNKLSKEESSLLNKWLEEERSLPDKMVLLHIEDCNRYGSVHERQLFHIVFSAFPIHEKIVFWKLLQHLYGQ